MLNYSGVTLSLPTWVDVESGCDHYHCRLGVSRLPSCVYSSVPPSTTYAISNIYAESGNGVGLILHIVTAKKYSMPTVKKFDILPKMIRWEIWRVKKRYLLFWQFRPLRIQIHQNVKFHAIQQCRLIHLMKPIFHCSQAYRSCPYWAQINQ